MRQVLALGLVVAALIAAGCGSGDAGTPSAAAGTSVLSGGLHARLLAASQHHLLARRAVALHLWSPGKARVRIAVTAVETIAGRQPGPRKLLTAGRSLSLAPAAPQTVRLPLTRRGAAALTTCAPYQLGIWVRPRGARRAQLAPLRAERVDTARCQRFFAPTSVWNQRLPADAPLDPDSQQLVASLRQQVAAAVDRRFWPTINTTKYSTPVYEVPENQRRVRVTLDDPATYRQALREALRAVPIPPGVRSAAGNDQHMVVWQPSRDTMWEFWKMHLAAGGWHAKAAGAMRDVSKNPGYFAGPRGSPWGATATSLPLLGGLMSADELERGRIDHALALAIPRPRASQWSLPAQRTDGWVREPTAVPEGAHFRLDPTLDVAALGLPRALRAMAVAAQRYGIIVRDTAATPAFYAEDPLSLGRNPYPDIFEHQAIGPLLARFPWDRLQALRLQLRTYSGPPKQG
jgi:hypothetical protein